MQWRGRARCEPHAFTVERASSEGRDDLRRVAAGHGHVYVLEEGDELDDDFIVSEWNHAGRLHLAQQRERLPEPKLCGDTRGQARWQGQPRPWSPMMTDTARSGISVIRMQLWVVSILILKPSEMSIQGWETHSVLSMTV